VLPFFRAKGFRFYFLSREEPRMHVHAQSSDGEAKFRIEAGIELAVNYGLKDRDLGTIEKLIREHEDEIRAAWNKHFGR
jgi:hypothetical protein